MLFFFSVYISNTCKYILGDLGIHSDLKAICKKKMCSFVMRFYVLASLHVRKHMKPLCYVFGGIWVFKICYLLIELFLTLSSCVSDSLLCEDFGTFAGY